MKLAILNIENRKGQKMAVNIEFCTKMMFSPDENPKLIIESGSEGLILSTGSRFPSQNYDPSRDVIGVELIFDDGSTETPYPKKHVDLEDLYTRLSHPIKVTEPKDIKA